MHTRQATLQFSAKQPCLLQNNNNTEKVFMKFTYNSKSKGKHKTTYSCYTL